MHSPLSEVVTAQKPHRIAVLVGLRSLWSTDSVGGSYTGYCRIGNDPLFWARMHTTDKRRLSGADPLQTVETRGAVGGTEPHAEGAFPSEKVVLQLVENETSPGAARRGSLR